MYAVIETGGKQYRVEVGTELEIERLEAGPGESVAFDRVLLIADGDAASIGRPVLTNASVAGEIVRRDRGEKVVSFKYRPKARRRVKKGHRQELTVVRISDIVLDGKSAAKEAKQAEDARLTERQRLEEGARRQAAKDAELAAKLASDKSATKAKPATKAKAADTTETADAAKSAPKAKAKASGTTRASSTSASTKAKPTDTTTKKTTRSTKTDSDKDLGSDMAHKKAGGSVKNGRDSVGQRLGIKAGDGQAVQAGAIIVRQRGMTFLAGEGTDLGGDYTLFATTAGRVKFEHARKDKKRVRVIPADSTEAAQPA